MVDTHVEPAVLLSMTFLFNANVAALLGTLYAILYRQIRRNRADGRKNTMQMQKKYPKIWKIVGGG